MLKSSYQLECFLSSWTFFCYLCFSFSMGIFSKPERNTETKKIRVCWQTFRIFEILSDWIILHYWLSFFFLSCRLLHSHLHFLLSCLLFSCPPLSVFRLCRCGSCVWLWWASAQRSSVLMEACARTKTPAVRTLREDTDAVHCHM